MTERQETRQELALSGGQAVYGRPEDLMTPKLWKLATEPADKDERWARIRAIARTPGLREEAARALPALIQMLDGRPNNAELGVALQPLLLIKRKPDFGKGAEGEKLTLAWQALYYAELRKFPLAAVRAGVKDLLSGHVYPDMPQPAELVKAIEPHAGKIRVAHYRLKEALRLEPGPDSRKIDRAANRKAMEEAGWLDRNGHVDAKRILAASGGQRPSDRRPGPSETPQEMARRIRGEG